jgi:type II secretory pathway pseudopilin PulG
MDWPFAVLLLAIAVTYLAWRRARRVNQLASVRAAALEGARWMYRLEYVRHDDGRGYVVTTEDGAELDRATLSWITHGLEIIIVDEAAADAGALADEAFDPGSGIRLTTGDGAGGDAVAVWDDVSSLRLVVLPDATSERVRARLEYGELSDCIVLWETRQDDVRTAVDLLLVHAEAAVVEA